MWRTTILVLVLATACGKGGGDAPTGDQCASFFTHMEELQYKEHGEPYQLVVDDEYRLFVERCPKVMTRAVIECGLKATDTAAHDKCISQDELDGKIGFDKGKD